MLPPFIAAAGMRRTATHNELSRATDSLWSVIRCGQNYDQTEQVQVRLVDEQTWDLLLAQVVSRAMDGEFFNTLPSKE